LVPIVLLPQLRPRSAAARPLATAACSGLAYALTGIATKLGVDDLARGAELRAAAWVALILFVALVATGNEMAALRTRRASQVVPIVLALEVVVPVLLAPLLTHERWRTTPGGGAILLIAVAVVVAGGVAIARTSHGAEALAGP